MAEDIVSKSTCEAVQKDIRGQIDNHKNRLDKHSEEIDDLRHLVDKLTVIEEQNAKLLEIAMGGSKPSHPDSKVWQQPWFKYVVITGCVVVVILIGAAVGDNVLDKYIEAMKLLKGGI
jgi:hypothetical protein